MSVTKTSGGRWRARVKSGRNAVTSRTFDFKRDAEVWLAAQKRLLDLGEFVDPNAGRETLASVQARWLAARAGTIASSTLKADTALLKYLPRPLLARPVASIRSSDIQGLLGELAQRGLAQTSVRRTRAVISSMFNWAVREKLVGKNPVADTTAPKGDGAGIRHEVYPFSIDELRSVVSELQDRDALQGEIALVLGLTGLRWGELVALRVRDVTSVPRPALRVTRSAPDGHPVKNVTKSGSARSVTLTAELVPIITRWSVGKSPDDLVFTSPNGDRLNGSNWRRAVGWKISNHGRRVHDLRHTAATFWLMSGIDPKQVQQWLGHASLTLTVDLYSHWMGSDAEEAAVLRIDRILGDAGGTHASNLGIKGDSH